MTRESSDQMAFVKTLTRKHIVYLAVPNGGTRNKNEARLLRKTGTKRGAPDIIIFTRPPALPYCTGVVVEFKTTHGKESDVAPTQTSWLNKLTALGWVSFVAFGLGDGLRKLKALGYDVFAPSEKTES